AVAERTDEGEDEQVDRSAQQDEGEVVSTVLLQLLGDGAPEQVRDKAERDDRKDQPDVLCEEGDPIAPSDSEVSEKKGTGGRHPTARSASWGLRIEIGSSATSHNRARSAPTGCPCRNAVKETPAAVSVATSGPIGGSPCSLQTSICVSPGNWETIRASRMPGIART